MGHHDDIHLNIYRVPVPALEMLKVVHLFESAQCRDKAQLESTIQEDESDDEAEDSAQEVSEDEDEAVRSVLEETRDNSHKKSDETKKTKKKSKKKKKLRPQMTATVRCPKTHRKDRKQKILWFETLLSAILGPKKRRTRFWNFSEHTYINKNLSLQKKLC
ncbi:uncharacterized protein LOC117171934 [Belonocnema kinseyi]|uniref:uncharacterized protein LOC117171934 n=1 Tax=Belonocnema kinseyi TaxID=2817044 RepID=UPI00143CFF02|nr:uncharacterized protein LOC117171934 [Belonocnema kinseyi]